MSDMVKQRAAYHETGHIVIIYMCAPNKEISRTTILSPESNSGSTWMSDKEKTQSLDKSALLTEIKMSLAGFVCEKMKFGSASNNVDKEFDNATTTAHKMVFRWGMGIAGYVGNFDPKREDYYLRGSGIINEELHKDAQDILENCFNEVKETLRKHWNVVEIFVGRLIEKGELTSKEIEEIFLQSGLKRPSAEELDGAKEMVEETKIGWDDIIGMDQVKMEAREMIRLITDRVAVQKIGGKILKGLLMIGPPGCGKTYLATAMANAAGLPFISKAGSEFVEMYVGVGASRIRRLFVEAKEKALEKGGCIIFIDEIDAVGAKRAIDQSSGGQSERNTTLNQLLVEMDGLREKDSQHNIVVIGATNMPSNFLDPALLRPGRFDRIIVMELPNLEEREQLFKYYLKQVKYDEESIKMDKLARLLVQSTPADIANLVHEAALIAVRNKKEKVGMQEINEARERISLGLKGKCRYSPQERERVAFHEAGHVAVTYLAVPFKDVFKASIIPRGGAGGVTWVPEREEIKIRDKSHLLANVKECLGGFASERIKYGNTSVGVASDFKQATDIVYDMSWSLGMGKSEFIGDFKSIKNGVSFRNELDADANEIMKECLRETEDLLRKNWEIVESIAGKLVEKEELDYDEIEQIFQQHGRARRPE